MVIHYEIETTVSECQEELGKALRFSRKMHWKWRYNSSGVVDWPDITVEYVLVAVEYVLVAVEYVLVAVEFYNAGDSNLCSEDQTVHPVNSTLTTT